MELFYTNKRVLVTGCTGFKGAWLCEALLLMGANVIGYALEPPTTPSLYDILNLGKRMETVIGDIRDLERLKRLFEEKKPEVVIHMAAQPIVRESYKNPVYTYDVNVMGTVNVLECIRMGDSVKSFVNVTTDKVYKNREWDWGYRENEELNGYDPYSNSKSCSELVTESYRNSFFSNRDIAITTMRAGNVIGGGDFAADRIIPDCVRSALEGKDIVIRNPYSVRPYQHVLEPVIAYLRMAAVQYVDISLAGSYNVGPDEQDCIATGQLAHMFCNIWKKHTDKSIGWINKYDGGPHEAGFLKLDCSKLKRTLKWKSIWSISTALDKAVEIYLLCCFGGKAGESVDKQIDEYIGAVRAKETE